jgi:hypothetical protein
LASRQQLNYALHTKNSDVYLCDSNHTNFV